jgi:hypothetical protein
MSTFTSLCRDKEHKDKIDVAHSFVTDEIRLVVWEDESQLERTVYLTPDEALHLHFLLTGAFTKIDIL